MPGSTSHTLPPNPPSSLKDQLKTRANTMMGSAAETQPACSVEDHQEAAPANQTPKSSVQMPRTKPSVNLSNLWMKSGKM